MKSEARKIIEKSLKDYETKTIKISGKEYPLYIVPELCDEDLNIFEGFLLVDSESKSEISFLKSKYKPSVSGYTPRIGLIFYDGHLLIKDYRRNRHIIKTLKKINKTFVNKVKKALTQPTEENFTKLFDRTDVIDEFYILFKKSREYLLNNISGITEEEKREEFVDNFMMQMLTLWYLQEREFFNNDINYFIAKFKELKQKKLFDDEFSSYYEFLTYFFEKISNNIGKQYYKDDKVGKVVVVGPAVFINGEQKKAVSIPDKCFYKDDLTDILINTPPKKVGDEVSLLNLFESRDWTEGNIDEFVLGAIYEKLITYMERKKLGAYYTPEEITSYICKNTIEPYLVDRVNERFSKNFETIDQVAGSDDKEIILYLFEQLKEIKILDPSVGSGHFLGSAIDVLAGTDDPPEPKKGIYEKIWEKFREKKWKGLNIQTSNATGEIIDLDLAEIEDKDEFRIYAKFFIILSKNIYGVDINPSAIKVARARLFLTIAKHFKVGKERDLFVRFPNVHFNLRAGNSLIGYVMLEKYEREPEKERNLVQVSLDFFNREEQANYIIERIKVVAGLKSYLEKTARNLNIDGNIVKEIKKVNSILSKKSVGWNDLEKVLRTKEKLIKILIASLNSQYAVPLNDLLREITDLFNQKLDEKFAEEHGIDLKELKKIKTFHWFFEFPEVFLDREGFDVVVGNPPYGNILLKAEKEIIENEYPFKTIKTDNLKGSNDASTIFVERAYSILREEGKFGMIMPGSVARLQKYEKIRDMLINNTHIYHVVDESSPFVGVGYEMISIFYGKEEPKASYNVHIFSRRTREHGQISINKWKKYNRLLLYWFEKDYIFDYIAGKNGLFLKLSQGKPRKADYVNREVDNKNCFYCIGATDITKYLIKFEEIREKRIVDLNYIKSNNLFDDLRKERVLCAYSISISSGASTKAFSNIFESVVKPKDYLPDGTSVVIRTSPENVNPYFLCCLLNTKVVNYIVCRYLFNYGYRSFGNYNYELFPIIKPSDIIIFKELYRYLNFMSYHNRKNDSTLKLLHELNEYIVYELYFKEKFAEDGLYPEPKEYLLEAVSKHLNPISYDRWSELYWKKAVEGDLTPEEQEELEKLEKENLKTIEEVYESLKEDEEVQKWIDKIKSHEWVKVIEGEQ